ncbi:MAG: hypothetical protein OWU84_02065 [Firmicutes bacterium]|nr:hypothetical protein [Bacillota bacterium]
MGLRLANARWDGQTHDTKRRRTVAHEGRAAEIVVVTGRQSHRLRPHQIREHRTGRRRTSGVVQ